MNMALFGGPFYKFMSASDVKYLMENKLVCVSGLQIGKTID